MKTPAVPALLLLPLLATPVLALASPRPAPPGDFLPDAPPAVLPSAPGAPGDPRRLADFPAAKTRRDGGKRSEKNETYLATETDQSAILVVNGSRLVLSNPTVHSSGATSDEEASVSEGLNAAVLARTGGSIEITGGSINSSGHGATTVFAHGSGSRIRLSKTKITASGPAARGILAVDKGAIEAVDLDLSTSGVRAAPIAAGEGGTVKVVRGRYRSTGTGSPAIHSAGEIELENADLLAADSEAALIEGKSSVNLVNCVLSGARRHGVLLRRNLSGDTQDGRGGFEMTGGSLSAAEGPLFHVAGATGVIRLSGVTLAPASGKLLLSTVDDRDGAGSDGGDARLQADAQTLAGDLAADADSTLSIVLENQSTLTGTIRSGALSLDSTSRWTATADSTLTTLAVANRDTARLVNIRSYGYLITYDDTRPENRWLGGKIHPLDGGGRLAPASSTTR